MSLIASVSAISRMYPTTADTATASTIPAGTRRRGSTVSSDTLADASYPVNVHCACSSPMTKAHQYGQPDSFEVTGRKKNAGGCLGANKNSAPTTTITPTT